MAHFCPEGWLSLSGTMAHFEPDYTFIDTNFKPEAYEQIACGKISTLADLNKALAQLTEIFLWENEHKADKAVCVQLNGNPYEVDQELTRKKILL